MKDSILKYSEILINSMKIKDSQVHSSMSCYFEGLNEGNSDVQVSLMPKKEI